MVTDSSYNLFTEEESFVKGVCDLTIFHNETNMYSVVKLNISETNLNYDEKEITVTGNFPRLLDDTTYKFYGSLSNHPRFGLQFQASRFEKEMPQTKTGIIAYLSSDIFKGVGKKTAENIVASLGEDAISKIMTNPAELDAVPRLSKRLATSIYDTLLEHEGLERIMIRLAEYGFGPSLSMKIYQLYKEETLMVIESNPYQIANDVEGVGFVRADELGRQLGICGSHPDRIKAAILYELNNRSLQEGNVYLNEDDLLSYAIDLLNSHLENEEETVALESLPNMLLELAEETRVVIEDGRIYLPSLFYSEKGIVSNLERILAETRVEEEFSEADFLLSLGKLEEGLKVQYAASQREAIQTALSSPILILTGGPGTGKTTVIKGIVELFAETHDLSLDPKDYNDETDPFPFILAAPTGRAAKRMSESTNLPALTIHRLLGWNGVEDFKYDEDNKLIGKIVIIDEMSMVDTWLAQQLFRALPDGIQVVLVGDEDQLPSVGPGQVLRDLIASRTLPTVNLTEIFRQEEGSSIVELAHSIKVGKLPADLKAHRGDRNFLEIPNYKLAESVAQVVKRAIDKGYDIMDVQVLAPIYRGQAGIDKLNQLLQEHVNPNDDGGKRQVQHIDKFFRVGDKVLQLVNNPEENIFNGDLGQIEDIIFARENVDKQDKVIVSFDGNIIEYMRQDLNQITHAYCTSVHKAQGSEFKIVVFPIVKDYYRMLKRNLIYTAITRSKSSLLMCGEMTALIKGIERDDTDQRQTTLMMRLRENLNFEESLSDASDEEVQLKQAKSVEKLSSKTELEIADKSKISQLSYEQFLMRVDPMIGMANITPYNYMD